MRKVTIFLCILLASCSVQPPTEFETGEWTTSPMGCIEGRKHGHNC